MGISDAATNRQRHLCDLLSIERPVLLAPMARIAGGTLAGAVSRAGGLGFLGAGYGDPGWLDENMAATNGARVGIGLIVWHMSPTAVEEVLAHDPVAVWLSFGDPAPHIDAIHEAGSFAVCQVGRVAEAVHAAEAGADILVVQGSEAGGHGRTGRALFGLIPAIAAAVPHVPLLGAGGITNQDGLNAASALGASGVALGTALYATHEATDTDAAKAHLVTMTGDDTMHSRVYDHVRGPLWPEEFTGRSVRTALTDRWHGREDELEAVLDDVQSDYAEAVAASDMSRRVLWAGEGLDRVTGIELAGDVVGRFARPGA